jgi:hypothetical protein
MSLQIKHCVAWLRGACLLDTRLEQSTAAAGNEQLPMSHVGMGLGVRDGCAGPCWRCRYGIHPGVIHPEWHSAQLEPYYWLHLQQQQGGKCLHKHSWGPQCSEGGRPAELPHALSIDIAETGFVNSGYIGLKVRSVGIFPTKRANAACLPASLGPPGRRASGCNAAHALLCQCVRGNCSFWQVGEVAGANPALQVFSSEEG